MFLCALFIPQRARAIGALTCKYRKRCLCALWRLGAGVAGGRCRVPPQCAAHKNHLAIWGLCWRSSVLCIVSALHVGIGGYRQERERENTSRLVDAGVFLQVTLPFATAQHHERKA